MKQVIAILVVFPDLIYNLEAIRKGEQIKKSITSVNCLTY